MDFRLFALMVLLLTPDRVNPDMSILGHILYDVVPYKWNLHLKGPKKAEEIDHATHPPNQGRDSNGNPCPPNDGSDNSKPCRNPCDN